MLLSTIIKSKLSPASKLQSFWQVRKQHSLTALKDANAWYQFSVKEIETLTHNTKRIRFELPVEHTLGLSTASCLLTRAKLSGEDYTIRPYTPTTTENAKGYFDLIIKVYENGNISKYLGERKVGDKVEIKGPLLKFKYAENMKKRIGMIAGGTGITPMYQVIQKILNNSSDKTIIDLLYANNSMSDIILKDELDVLSQKHENLIIHNVLKETDGFINENLITERLPKSSDDCMIFVCGPPAMMEAVSGDKAKDKSQGELSGLLKKLGYNKDNVYKF